MKGSQDHVCCGCDRENLHYAENDIEVFQDDILEILRALGLKDHARGDSPHDIVHDKVLPAIRRLREIESAVNSTRAAAKGKSR